MDKLSSITTSYTTTHSFAVFLVSECHNWVTNILLTDLVDCIYLWTLVLKTCFHMTSNIYVSGVKLSSFPPKLKLTWPQMAMFQVSNFEVFPPKPEVLLAESVLSWFTQFTIFTVWGKPAKITDMERRKSIKDYIWVGNFKVWNLKHKRLRSRKLKFGQGNFKVWHLKHRRLTLRENMFLARAFVGRCNRR